MAIILDRSLLKDWLGKGAGANDGAPVYVSAARQSPLQRAFAGGPAKTERAVIDGPRAAAPYFGC